MPDIVETIADCLLEDHMALMQENAALRHRAYNLQCLLQEYLDLNGDYAATMPKSEWVERVREACK